MEQVLYFDSIIANYLTDESVVFQPTAYQDGFIVPLGWEWYLESIDCDFEVIDFKRDSSDVIEDIETE